MRKAILPYRNQQYCLALMADQSPPIPGRAYWLNFFGRPTAFLAGTEKGARLGKMPIIYADLIKTGRGRYHFRMSLLAADAGHTSEGELTRKYVRALEDNIREYPSGYLWSHRRWKLGWTAEYINNWVDTDPQPAV
jgi:KDO2-lipid IV(A) lauroyltransferase